MLIVIFFSPHTALSGQIPCSRQNTPLQTVSLFFPSFSFLQLCNRRLMLLINLSSLYSFGKQTYLPFVQRRRIKNSFSTFLILKLSHHVSGWSTKCCDTFNAYLYALFVTFAKLPVFHGHAPWTLVTANLPHSGPSTFDIWPGRSRAQCLMLFVLHSSLIPAYKNLWWHFLPAIKYS